MRKLRHWLLMLPVFIFVTAFQNCSVYKTSGRKYVEDGSAKAAKDISTQTTSASSTTSLPKVATATAPAKPKRPTTCAPYIDDAAASEAMGTFSTTKLVFDEASESASCLISANEASENPALDYVACSVSAANLELLQNPPDQTTVLDPYGPLSRGSLGFSRKLASGATQFVFVGASDTAMEAVACQFVFDTEQEYQMQADAALERGARLVHAMYLNLR